jgi:hypothetical protein
MEAHYSGGNDEGGVDDVVVLRPAGRDYLLWPLQEVMYGPEKGSLVRGYAPVAGPFPTKKAALEHARSLEGRFEAVKAEGEDVRLIGAEGSWDDENGLHRLVDDLLSHDFGTWAGDFSASGIVYADVAEGRVWREGEMSTYVSDESAGEY